MNMLVNTLYFDSIFLYSHGLISKKRYVFRENLVWMCYTGKSILNSLVILISLSLISLFNHIVFKHLKVVTMVH